MGLNGISVDSWSREEPQWILRDFEGVLQDFIGSLGTLRSPKGPKGVPLVLKVCLMDLDVYSWDLEIAEKP